MTVYSQDPRIDTPRNRGDYDAPHMTPVTPAEDIRSIMINRVSWGAIFAGVTMALVVQLILNLTGVGVGIALKAGPSTGAMIWMAVSGVVAFFVGGYTAGRLSGDPTESTAGWHGLTAWAASVFVLAILIIGGAGVMMGGTLNGVGLNPAAMAGMAALGGTDQGAAEDLSTMDLEMSAQTLAQTEGIPLDEARVRVQQSPGFDSTATGATVSPEMFAQGALMGAIALVLGALAAWLGGRMSVVKPTITSDRLRNTH